MSRRATARDVLGVGEMGWATDWSRRAALVAGLAGAVALGACSGDGGASVAVDGVEVVRFADAGLSFLLEITTEAPAGLQVGAVSDGHRVDVPQTDVGGTDHEIALVGLRPDRTYEVTIVAVTADGDQSPPHTTQIETPPLPDDFPPLAVEIDADRVAEGVTIFDTIPFPGEGGVTPPAYVVAVDTAGEVVWWYRNATAITDVSPTPRGTLVVSVSDLVMREIDLLGRTLLDLGGEVAFDLGRDLLANSYTTDTTERLATDSVHHEVYELASGNLLALSTEVLEHDSATGERLCPDLPASTFTGDVVVEFTPDGEPVAEWSIADMLDPVARPGTDLCVAGNPIAPPNWFHPDVDARDWTHGNAVVLDEATNTVVVSLRHLDAIIGYRYEDDDAGPSGELLWELGPNGTLALESGDWQYHQHAPEVQEDGSLLVYDNGNGRPGTESPYSRAVHYDIDFDAGTVSQRWEHRAENADGSPVFAAFLGDADALANGNVLITHGGQVTSTGTIYGRVIEVVPDGDAGGDIVLDIAVGDAETVGFGVYRADHLPSLYFAGADLR
ncbi:MAG: aryl-sulfate sulfotransferase [Actinomycetota bacterium]